MYQEWDSPAFKTEQLIEVCREFFRSQQFETSVEKTGKGTTILSAEIAPINQIQTLKIESKGTKLRLTYVPIDRSSYGLARMASVFVTGLIFKTDSERQLFADRLEEQFWENLDRWRASLNAAGYPESGGTPLGKDVG